MEHPTTYIYRFSTTTVDGNGAMHEELGSKGAGLAEMARLSIPVPPGFTISTAACRHYLSYNAMPKGFTAELESALHWLEEIHDKKLDDGENPLLVSVRSGAAVSMPGMMDTILNVGLNRHTLSGLSQPNGSLRFAFDSYRRLLQMFGSIVFGIPKKQFDRVLDEIKIRENAAADSDISPEGLTYIIDVFEEIFLHSTNTSFPQDPRVQLSMAIEAVFQSWRNDRAQHYRRLNNIPDSSGTAVTVQAMAFGNRGVDSGTGVGFTRNPSTGAREIFGEFLLNAQGEDIVAGTRTPLSINHLEERMPQVYQELSTIARRLETHYRDAQDFEFTVENGKLFLLQTRSAKRGASAAVRIAVEMANEGLISKQEAVSRVKTSSINEILTPQIDFSAEMPEPITQGLATSPGAAAGRIVLTADEAVRMASLNRDTPLILVTQETTADDIHGMAVSAGFLTAHGGATSHAAVVARGMGKVCITGAKDLVIDEAAGTLHIGKMPFQAGDWLTLDGSTGHIFVGKLPLRIEELGDSYLDTLLQWAVDLSSTTLRVNADTPQDAIDSLKAKPQGIGLCRTEHMFFAPDRLPHVRSMILAETIEQRKEALDKLLPTQREDFAALFRAMSPRPVTIRLLDPPLNEFLPKLKEVDAELEAARKHKDTQKIKTLETLHRRVELLMETNPMMGHRGCRLSITYPEILVMQVSAIFQAAMEVCEEGFIVVPEIMIPLVVCAEEIRHIRRLIEDTAMEIFSKDGRPFDYTIGTMIELPRAAVCAGTFADQISFASFGTNDLTQMAFGFSRDDSRKYLESYIEQGILASDPFVTIDREGVGSLMKTAIQQLRTKNPKIKIGVCGEHGGDPDSISFFKSIGVDYISCSPARLLIAQLALAQSEI